MESNKISKAVIRRLPRYYRYLEELQSEGILRISSGELSGRMNVTASQIRQDLNHFGGFGQQGYGYNVKSLYEEIGKILGISEKTHIILIGAGNLGHAIANYANYRNRGFFVEAVFDNDPQKIRTDIHGMKVLPMEELETYVKTHRVDIATIAIPKQFAIPLAERLVGCGIKAFWNFAHTDLHVPGDVAVENVHLSESLMNLTYKVKEMKEKQ